MREKSKYLGERGFPNEIGLNLNFAIKMFAQICAFARTTSEGECVAIFQACARFFEPYKFRSLRRYVTTLRTKPVARPYLRGLLFMCTAVFSITLILREFWRVGERQRSSREKPTCRLSLSRESPSLVVLMVVVATRYAGRICCTIIIEEFVRSTSSLGDPRWFVRMIVDKLLVMLRVVM